DPYLVVLNSLPKSALAPLLIVWLGANQTTIIVAGMSVAIFGSILSLYTSFINVDPDELKLIYTLHGNRFHALTKVILPSSVPSMISTMKINIGLCLVGVVIGEFLAARNGLGYLIIYSSQVFKMDWLLMSICLLCIMAIGLYAVIGLFEKKFQR
ncbi:MAG: ABC transporter permease subunit, partial [Hespellia sp.]|nr:ABC transporter permease subunit [Hespellia sp.]